MDFETSQIIRNELSQGESLIWSGRPRQGFVLRKADLFLIPFSILWVGFAFFWEYQAFTSDAPLFFLIFGGFFVIYGLFFVFGRFISDILKRKGTFYGVSTDRVIILSVTPTRKLQSLNLDTLNDITLSMKQDGSGDILFGPQNPMASRMKGISWPGMPNLHMPMFELIENAGFVYQEIRDEQKKSV